jgi:hypothetical protein
MGVVAMRREMQMAIGQQLRLEGRFHETILQVHGSFDVPFSLCLAGRLEIPSGATKGIKPWGGVKQRFIIQRKRLT